MPLNAIIATELDKLPQSIQQNVVNKIAAYQEKIEKLGMEIPVSDDFYQSLPKVWFSRMVKS